eukprot:scaffold10079_cov113-Isochrysis_galbana.AAC.1
MPHAVLAGPTVAPTGPRGWPGSPPPLFRPLSSARAIQEMRRPPARVREAGLRTSIQTWRRTIGRKRRCPGPRPSSGERSRHTRSSPSGACAGRRGPVVARRWLCPPDEALERTPRAPELGRFRPSRPCRRSARRPRRARPIAALPPTCSARPACGWRAVRSSARALAQLGGATGGCLTAIRSRRGRVGPVRAVLVLRFGRRPPGPREPGPQLLMELVCAGRERAVCVSVRVHDVAQRLDEVVFRTRSASPLGALHD